MITLPEICMSAIDQAVELKNGLRDPASIVLLERTVNLAISAFNSGNEQAMRVYIRELRAWTHPELAEIAS
jgi:hypothetical protein